MCNFTAALATGNAPKGTPTGTDRSSWHPAHSGIGELDIQAVSGVEPSGLRNQPLSEFGINPPVARFVGIGLSAILGVARPYSPSSSWPFPGVTVRTTSLRHIENCWRFAGNGRLEAASRAGLWRPRILLGRRMEVSRRLPRSIIAQGCTVSVLTRIALRCARGKPPEAQHHADDEHGPHNECQRPLEPSAHDQHREEPDDPSDPKHNRLRNFPAPSHGARVKPCPGSALPTYRTRDLVRRHRQVRWPLPPAVAHAGIWAAAGAGAAPPGAAPPGAAPPGAAPPGAAAPPSGALLLRYAPLLLKFGSFRHPRMIARTAPTAKPVMNAMQPAAASAAVPAAPGPVGLPGKCTNQAARGTHDSDEPGSHAGSGKVVVHAFQGRRRFAVTRKRGDGVALLNRVGEFVRKHALALRGTRIVLPMVEEDFVSVGERPRLETAAESGRPGIGVDADGQKSAPKALSISERVSAGNGVPLST